MNMNSYATNTKHKSINNVNVSLSNSQYVMHPVARLIAYSLEEPVQVNKCQTTELDVREFH